MLGGPNEGTWADLRGVGCDAGVRFNNGVDGPVFLNPASLSGSHLYNFTRDGNGEAWSFDFIDCFPTNNSGNVTVRVFVNPV